MAKKKQVKLLSAGPMFKLLRELRTAAREEPYLVIGGDPARAEELRRALATDGDARAVRVGSPRGAAAFVYIAPAEVDVRALRDAHLGGVPTIAVTPGSDPPAYVLATDVVPADPGRPVPVDAVARSIARRLGVRGTPLAARLPALREAVCAHLVESFARRNAILGAAVFIPGADMPVMTLNQMRLVMRLASAHGLDAEPVRAAELVGVIGSGFGLRFVGRSLLGLFPLAGVPVRAGVGYAGTRAVGEAANRYYANRQ